MYKLKLNHLSDRQLAEKQMNNVRGGENQKCPGGCCCSCAYAGSGGSSTNDNLNANEAQGKRSVHGCLPEVTIPAS
ncbi:TIGR04149 family rSAM-modified RiPP [Bacteroidales bacterium OttesenSCG-928-K22]|nr:TIGR04149 family rSAM-modified RiPP [Bacteroidales bacterium OttesenSCG-928-L14]MDL2240201.1 TIGR04149 family rSAM-modified RiPP [Bacteroidales bacterium OttesenSCG-928-K22]